MTLGEKQELFVELQARWVLWVLSHPGWKLRQGEGRILQLGPDGKSGRRARLVTGVKRDGTPLLSAAPVRVKDLVHMDGGTHYDGISTDWQLFVDGVYITRSDHPAWIECGREWKSMHGDCCWGGVFDDGNHISLLSPTGKK